MYIIAFISGFVNSILGNGGGTVAIFLLTKVIKDKQKIFSSLCAFILPVTIVSVIISYEHIKTDILFSVCFGGIIGGFFGNKISDKIKNEYLSIVFSVIIIFLGVKSLF